MALCYILYSEKLDQFYTGSTSSSMEDRLYKHLTKFYDKSAQTAKSDDWVLFKEISCDDIAQARKIEAHIKKMKSKKYITNLKKYPEMVEKLLLRFK